MGNNMAEKIFPADKEALGQVQEYVEEELQMLKCPMKILRKIMIVVEEIFVNIASYAYEGEDGIVSVKISFDDAEQTIMVRFTDSGVPFNPLEAAEPDITLSADERQIGGLGIFMVKKMMDDVCYARVNGENILTMKKKIEKEYRL